MQRLQNLVAKVTLGGGREHASPYLKELKLQKIIKDFSMGWESQFIMLGTQKHPTGPSQG